MFLFSPNIFNVLSDIVKAFFLYSILVEELSCFVTSNESCIQVCGKSTERIASSRRCSNFVVFTKHYLSSIIQKEILIAVSSSMKFYIEDEVFLEGISLKASRFLQISVPPLSYPSDQILVVENETVLTCKTSLCIRK